MTYNLEMTYRNWRGEIAQRRIIPLHVEFGSTEWHPEPCWLLRAFDEDKKAERDFALTDCMFADLTAVPVTGKTIEELTAPSRAWYSSNDEEYWSGGPYADRAEAEVEAEGQEHRLICEAGKRAIRVSALFDADDFIERADESLDDEKGEDQECILDFTKEQAADLEKRVREAIDAWQVAHQLAPMPWVFDFSHEETAAWVKEENDQSSPDETSV